jgi:hypothetical protein
MSQVITGARGRVRINDKVVGFVGGVNVTVENTLTDVDIMGQLEVGDLAETAHKCNFSINYFKAVSDAGVASASAKGEFVPNSATAIGIDTSSQASGVLPMRDQAYFEVVLEDDQTDEPIFILEKCKFEGGTGQVDARGLWQGTWNFRALRGYGL